MTTSITSLGIWEIAIPMNIPPTEDPAKIRTQIKCLQNVTYLLAASSTPRQKPTTSLWEAIAPSNSKTYEKIKTY